jgi:hypothetical protein
VGISRSSESDPENELRQPSLRRFPQSRRIVEDLNRGIASHGRFLELRLAEGTVVGLHRFWIILRQWPFRGSSLELFCTCLLLKVCKESLVGSQSEREATSSQRTALLDLLVCRQRLVDAL